MRPSFLTLFVALAVAGCGGRNPSTPPAAAGNSPPAALPDAKAAPKSGNRRAELIDPDESTMVLLYYSLAQIEPPFPQWLDDDMRVRMAPASDKPAARDLVRRELEAGYKGVHAVGALRLSMSANLSDYDMTYGEFTVRALAPSSVVEYKGFGQKVSLKFGNARSAQVWRVPQTEAQGVRDRIGFPSDVSLDVSLRIRDVHAAPEGGTITADVVEYELRENRSGSLLGRVQLAPPT